MTRIRTLLLPLVVIASFILCSDSWHASAEESQSRGTKTLDVTLPLKPKSVRFAVIGDNGTGERPQYQIAEEMRRFHDLFPFEFVVMLGDNLYGHESPADFK